MARGMFVCVMVVLPKCLKQSIEILGVSCKWNNFGKQSLEIYDDIYNLI